MVWAAIASAYLGDLHSAGELATRAVSLARAAGSFNTLPIALLGSARFDVNASAFDGAEECAREGIELTRQLEQENLETCLSAILVRCLAARGQIDECRELGEATLNRALAHGLAVAADDVRLGIAELELSLGHGAAARDMIDAVSHPLFRLVATPMLVEATLLSGEREPGPETLDALAKLAEQAQDPRRLGPPRADTRSAGSVLRGGRAAVSRRTLTSARARVSRLSAPGPSSPTASSCDARSAGPRHASSSARRSRRSKG